jgi:hypothetical protein
MGRIKSGFNDGSSPFRSNQIGENMKFLHPFIRLNITQTVDDSYSAPTLGQQVDAQMSTLHKNLNAANQREFALRHQLADKQKEIDMANFAAAIWRARADRQSMLDM